MKNYVTEGEGLGLNLRKLFLKMKLTAFIVILFVFQTFAESTLAQGKFSLDFKNKTIEQVLLEIENQSDIGFMYNKDLVDVNRKINIDVKDASIDKILNQLFPDDNVNFHRVNNQIVISPKFDTVQQQKTVTGKVTDENGEPLPGVTVVIRNTTTGTVTNVDGDFSLTAKQGDVLQFSFVGMKSQEVEVGNQSSIDITLGNDAIGLEEVIAIGYGSLKKQAVTGSVANAKIELYKDVPTNNILESIKGSLPGLNVGGTNQAGQVAGLSIRGTNSTGASNSPLLVVDGVIFNGSIADIASNDIKSFTVLKDASAAAVYGARSANGVIIIETKGGKSIGGKPKFEVNVSHGISNQLKPLKVYDADGYLQRVLDIRELNDQEANPNDIAIYLEENERENYLATPDHRPSVPDPYGLISQTGNNTKLNFSVANSTEKSNYYISVSSINQKGIVLNDEYKNLTGRINISSDLTDWFHLGIRSFYSYRDYSGDSPSMYRATHMSPFAQLKGDDGKYLLFPQTTTSFASPFWDFAKRDHDNRNNLNGIVTGRITIPWIKGLTYTANLSKTIRWNERFYYYDKDTRIGTGVGGRGRRQYNRWNDMLLDNIVKYNRSFADKHNVDITLLYSREENSWEHFWAEGEDYDNENLLDYGLENALTQKIASGGGESASIGQMARATYTFDKKYSLTGTVRRDGFSAFSKNKKWGVFSSAGINWNISKEGFMDNVSWVDDLALRVSYGSNGNQAIGAYQTLARVETSKYLYAGDASYSITQGITSIPLEDLSWETTTGLNLGIDFGLLNHRLSGSIDMYSTKTTDLLFDKRLLFVAGVGTTIKENEPPSILSNIGQIDNKGIELSLNSVNVQRTDFTWTSDFAFSLNRNKVASIRGEDNDGDGIEDDLPNEGFFIGESLGTIYDYKVNGIYNEGDNILTGQRIGDYDIEDVDGDGAITSDKDRQIIGTTHENFRWSLTNTFKYKKFTVMAYLYSIWGGNGYFLSTRNTPQLDGYANRGDINHPVYDYWTPTNTDAEFPRTDYGARATYSRAKKLYDRSFIKLQKVSVAYDLSSVVAPYGIKNLTLSASADNLFTYAPHWIGLDPETDSGLSDTALPSIRTYLFSLSFNF